MLFKRVAAVLALGLGIAGSAGCLAGAYAAWRTKSRIDQANAKVFDAVDRSLKSVQDRMTIVQQRVKESKVTTNDVAGAIREWGAKKGQDRVVSQLQIESKVEKLTGLLQTADLKLEASTEAVRDIRQLLELGQGLGVMVNLASADAIQELLASVQETLQQAVQTVDGVGKFLTNAANDPNEEQQAQIAKMLARILVTLSGTDRRLADFTARIVEAQSDAQHGKATTSHYIEMGAVLSYVLLTWIIAGQVALVCWGWTSCRHSRLPAV